MAKKQKYYVVWVGVSPGIYTSWTDCRLQTKGYEGALFKSFDTREEAEQAFAAPPRHNIGRTSTPPAERPIAPDDRLPEAARKGCLVVDAACSGNPGQMEYRGVYLPGFRQVFHYGPVYGTNNIGEFLAIVHALAWLRQQKLDMPVYSDSRNALLWVRQKKCKTRLPRDARSEPLFQVIERAERWLRENAYHTPLLKWDTRQWGEIPADFGRK